MQIIWHPFRKQPPEDRHGKGKPTVKQQVTGPDADSLGLGRRGDRHVGCLVGVFPATACSVGATIDVHKQGNQTVLPSREQQGTGNGLKLVSSDPPMVSIPNLR